MKPVLTLKSLAISANPTRDYHAKEIFHQDGKTFLRAVAKALGLQPTEFDLRSNKGGPAVSGEITLHTDRLYLQLSHSCMAPGAQVMFRTCDSRKDYTGHVNNFVQLAGLKDPLDQQIWLKQLATLNRGVRYNEQPRSVNRVSTGLV